MSDWHRDNDNAAAEIGAAVGAAVGVLLKTAYYVIVIAAGCKYLFGG